MKEGWKYCKLGEIATFSRGLTYSKKDEAETSDNIVLRSNNVDLSTGKLCFDELKYLKSDFIIPQDKLVKKGSLLMCMSNGSKSHLGKVAFIEQDYNYAFGGFMGLVTPVDFVDGKYLHYALSSPFYKNFIKELSAGANINNIKVRDLQEFTIPVPPLSEQQSIVTYLDTSFSLIDSLAENAKKALENAKALFQAELKKLMEKKEGWEEKKLKDIGLTQTGTTPSKSDKSNYGDYIPFIRPSEIDYDSIGGIDYDSEIKLSEQGLSKGRLFKSHSILMVCIGATIGKVGYCTKDVSCNQQINVLTPKEQYDFKYIYYAMLAPNFKKEVIKQGTSSQATLPIINKGKWEQLTIAIPSLEEQHCIVQTLDTLSQYISQLEQNYNKTLDNCQALKQALLRETFE